MKIFHHLLGMWLIRVLAQALLNSVKQYAAPVPGLTSSTRDINKPSLQRFEEHKQAAQMRCLYCCGSPQCSKSIVSSSESLWIRMICFRAFWKLSLNYSRICLIVSHFSSVLGKKKITEYWFLVWRGNHNWDFDRPFCFRVRYHNGCIKQVLLGC